MKIWEDFKVNSYHNRRFGSGKFNTVGLNTVFDDAYIESLYVVGCHLNNLHGDETKELPKHKELVEKVFLEILRIRLEKIYKEL